MEEIRKVAAANGEEDRDTVFHIFQQLGMALQKGNAAIFVCRMETVYKMVNRGEVKLARKNRINKSASAAQDPWSTVQFNPLYFFWGGGGDYFLFLFIYFFPGWG